jgi:transposase
MSKPSQSPKQRRRRRKEIPQDIPTVDVLKQINVNAAGLDIGDDQIYAAVPEGQDKKSVRVFGTFTTHLHTLVDWLEACEVTTVAMESTGIYWIPIYEILEKRGFEVYLVNASHIKNVTGKKTDILDCQWIQQLHTYGLLRASFRPPEDIAALRSLVRHRANLIRSATAEIQHMQKALQLMNLKLTNVVSDITGLTGMCIIRDIVSGVHDPGALAKHRDPRCAKGQNEIALALQGNYKAEHLFALKQALEAYDFYQSQIQRCDEQMEGLYNVFEPQVDIDERPLPSSRKRRRKPKDNEPDFDLRLYLYQMAGVDLTEIDGINVLTAQVVLSEIGTDMSKWPTVKHFTSWLGLCPHNDKTGGKVIRTRTRKTQNRAAAALRMSASTLSHSHSALGGYYRRMRAKLGAPEAVTATAHKLARIIYAMLKNQTEYQDPGEGYYEEQARQRAIKNLKRKANQLGFQLMEKVAS